MSIRRFDVEQPNGRQHDEIDDGEDDEDPKCDGGDEVGDDFVDDAAGDGEGDGGEGGAASSGGQREDFGWVYPANSIVCRLEFCGLVLEGGC